ncbi:MAG: hypothetical protein QME46_01100 [Thermoanaerobacteraceae bacterium]|nr:hypothetical protein [Thermoanaerobacteraceae bacterium]
MLRTEVLQGVKILTAIGGLSEAAGILGDAFTATGRRIIPIPEGSLYTASFFDVGREEIIKKVADIYILKKRTDAPSTVSGPTSLKLCREMALSMPELGAERSIIVSDILASTSPEVCDGIALTVRDQEEYDYLYSRLNLPEIGVNNDKSAIIGEEITPIEFLPLGRGRDIAAMIKEDTEAVFIKGAITFGLIMDILSRRNDITVIGEYPSSFVLERDEWLEVHGKVGLACIRKAPILVVVSDRFIFTGLPLVEV